MDRRDAIQSAWMLAVALGMSCVGSAEEGPVGESGLPDWRVCPECGGELDHIVTLRLWSCRDPRCSFEVGEVELVMWLRQIELERETEQRRLDLVEALKRIADGRRL
jgi:hypothetical protein